MVWEDSTYLCAALAGIRISSTVAGDIILATLKVFQVPLLLLFDPIIIFNCVTMPCRVLILRVYDIVVLR
jgi:hypothetical protein